MDFKNLIVYQKALAVKQEMEARVLSLPEVDKNLKDQIRRAATSIVLNISEGSSRFSPPDRKNFFIISRGSVFECMSSLEIVFQITNKRFEIIEGYLEEISKMLFKMISNLAKKK